MAGGFVLSDFDITKRCLHYTTRMYARWPTISQQWVERVFVIVAIMLAKTLSHYVDFKGLD